MRLIYLIYFRSQSQTFTSINILSVQNNEKPPLVRNILRKNDNRQKRRKKIKLRPCTLVQKFHIT